MVLSNTTVRNANLRHGLHILQCHMAGDSWFTLSKFVHELTTIFRAEWLYLYNVMP